MAAIHPTAVVAPGAELGDDVAIGPYCCVGGNVRLGHRVRLISHVVVDGHTTLGDDTTVYPFAALGLPPQHLRYQGEPTTLVVGRRNIIREHVTMHPGTPFGARGSTTVGDECLFMVATHVAHDCRIGDHVVMANNATIGGHVRIGDYALLGGLAAVHQYVRIGHHAVIGGMSGVENDVIPYGSVMGERARLSGLNIVGLKRRGFSRDDIHSLRNAYRLLFAQEGTMAERLSDVTELFTQNTPVMDIVAFIREDSTRAICQPRAGGG